MCNIDHWTPLLWQAGVVTAIREERFGYGLTEGQLKIIDMHRLFFLMWIQV